MRVGRSGIVMVLNMLDHPWRKKEKELRSRNYEALSKTVTITISEDGRT